MTDTGQRCSASTIWRRTISHPLTFFDANGATIRQVLGMRSGIPGLSEFTPEGGSYPAEQASTAVKVFKKLLEPEVAPGGEPDCASTDYVLLGTIIEHVTGRTLRRAGLTLRQAIEEVVEVRCP
jgi:CubicO group peptidase (beta-lactamase class C family)